MQNLNTKETMARGVIVLNVSEMPQENISVGKGQNYLLVGDNAIWLKKIPDNSIDSIVTDPPAGISFMSRGWDSDKGGRDHWIAWMCEVATECKRVLKPGGHAFVWAIPRTSHWTATAWENAGFEIRDVVAHIFGSGFPKSLNIGKAVDKMQGNEREIVGETRIGKTSMGDASGWDTSEHMKAIKESGSVNITKGTSEWEGWGTALKPAREDWILMRKPIESKTVAQNVLKYGTGGINIDESRVISYTTAYNDGDNNDCNLQEHTVLEIRHKICSEPPFSLSESLELSRLSSDDEYGQKWYKQRDYSDDCSSCRRLYDALLPLFLKGDQVSVQQLHDVLDDIDHLRIEQKHNLSSQYSDLHSSLDDFYQLILSYLNDTTLILNKQEKITLNLNKKGEQLFNEGDVKKAKWSGDSEERTGRFPANLIHDNSEEVRECFPETKSVVRISEDKDEQQNTWSLGRTGITPRGHNDSGNASRFFKSIREECPHGNWENWCDEEGCKDKVQISPEEWEKMNTFKSIIYQAKSSKSERTNGGAITNSHPTIKPIALMEYLIKMVTPKGGTVLDPFAGSGSTLVAAKQNGYQYIGIEMTEEYIPIIEARLK